MSVGQSVSGSVVLSGPLNLNDRWWRPRKTPRLYRLQSDSGRVFVSPNLRFNLLLAACRSGDRVLSRDLSAHILIFLSLKYKYLEILDNTCTIYLLMSATVVKNRYFKKSKNRISNDLKKEQRLSFFLLSRKKLSLWNKINSMKHTFNSFSSFKLFG